VGEVYYEEIPAFTPPTPTGPHLPLAGVCAGSPGDGHREAAMALLTDRWQIEEFLFEDGDLALESLLLGLRSLRARGVAEMRESRVGRQWRLAPRKGEEDGEIPADTSGSSADDPSEHDLGRRVEVLDLPDAGVPRGSDPRVHGTGEEEIADRPPLSHIGDFGKRDDDQPPLHRTPDEERQQRFEARLRRFQNAAARAEKEGPGWEWGDGDEWVRTHVGTDKEAVHHFDGRYNGKPGACDCEAQTYKPSVACAHAIARNERRKRRDGV
jgi:hypothetical protein